MSSKNTRAKGIDRIVALICLLPSILLPTGLEAQQPKKMARIGYLSAYSGPPQVSGWMKDQQSLGSMIANH